MMMSDAEKPQVWSIDYQLEGENCRENIEGPNTEGTVRVIELIAYEKLQAELERAHNEKYEPGSDWHKIAELNSEIVLLQSENAKLRAELERVKEANANAAIFTANSYQAELESAKAEIERLENERLRPDQQNYLRRCKEGHVFLLAKPGTRPFEESIDCPFCVRNAKLQLMVKSLSAKCSKYENALIHISSMNKNDGKAPKDNKGPHTMAYWAWQEDQSRDIAYTALEEAKAILEESEK